MLTRVRGIFKWNSSLFPVRITAFIPNDRNRQHSQWNFSKLFPSYETLPYFQELRSPGGVQLAQVTVHLPQCLPPLSLGLSMNQVTQAFYCSQIQLAIQKCTGIFEEEEKNGLSEC